MAWLNNLALQKRISLLVLIGLAIALGLFSLMGIQSLNESTSRILDQRLAISRILANNIDQTLAHILAHLQSVGRSGIALNADQFNSTADSLRQILTDTGVPVRSIILVDPVGKVLLAQPDDPSIVGADWSQLAAVRQALDSAQPIVSNLMTEPGSNAQVVLAIAPTFDDGGRFSGLLAGSVDIAGSGIRTVSQMMQIGNTGYVEIVDGNGLVLARTTPGVPPKLMERSDHPGHFADLIREDKAVVGTCHRCHEVNQSLQRRRDVLAFAPLATVSWGVAIRQSEAEALGPTRTLETRLLILGLVILAGSLLLVAVLTQGVVRPIGALTAQVKKVAVGDFRAVVPIKRQDEIGQLSSSVCQMASELEKSRDQLVSRNKELTALNSVSVAASQSLNLKNLLENALSKVLEVVHSHSGCVFLGKGDASELAMVIGLGSTAVFGCAQSGVQTAVCGCHKVVQRRQPAVMNDVTQCPALTSSQPGRGRQSFVSIPLQTKNRVVGIMNILCSDMNHFTASDLKLFTSIGYQIGLAVENSVLYEEAKEEEESRGRLLSSVISAQEEERKRISRELHDESGQTLTAAIMNIESIEDMVSPTRAELKEKVLNTKALLNRTLEDIRRLTHDLRPMALDDLGLDVAIRTYVKNRLEAAAIQVQFETKGLLSARRLAPAIETALFRIIQEATNNILKHADAHNVKVSLSADDGLIRATVEDDGKGFDTAAVFSRGTKGQSLGLLGIKERAALLGGAFSVKSKRHKGTQLIVEIPVTPRHELERMSAAEKATAQRQ